VYYAKESDPLVTVCWTYSVTRDDCMQIRMPVDAQPAAGLDHDMAIVSPDGRTVYEGLGWDKQADGSWQTHTFYPVDLYRAGVPVQEEGFAQMGARAYGGSKFAGLIRVGEVEAGAIQHVLAVALDSSQLARGPVWPASMQDGNSRGTYSGTIPMGTLLAIPPTVDINSLGLTLEGLIVARALQDYGAYVTTRGVGGFALYGEPSLPDSFAAAVRADMSKFIGVLRPVLNNTPDTPGGGGTPRAPLVPPLRAP
jgi:hypothetical protein